MVEIVVYQTIEAVIQRAKAPLSRHQYPDHLRTVLVAGWVCASGGESTAQTKHPNCCIHGDPVFGGRFTNCFVCSTRGLQISGLTGTD